MTSFVEAHIDFIDEQIKKYNFSVYIRRKRSKRWSIDIFWPGQCKRGGDMQISHVESESFEDAIEETSLNLKKWLETHKEELEQYEANRNM